MRPELGKIYRAYFLALPDQHFILFQLHGNGFYRTNSQLLTILRFLQIEGQVGSDQVQAQIQHTFGDLKIALPQVVCRLIEKELLRFETIIITHRQGCCRFGMGLHIAQDQGLAIRLRKERLVCHKTSLKNIIDRSGHPVSECRG